MTEKDPIRQAVDWLRHNTKHLTDEERHEGLALFDAALSGAAMTDEQARDGIERLALVLADEDLYDFLVGDRWMGWPNDENDDEVRDYIESVLPRCRERAQRYADLLNPPEVGGA